MKALTVPNREPDLSWSSEELRKFLATEEKLGKRIYEKEGGSGVFCQQKQS